MLCKIVFVILNIIVCVRTQSVLYQWRTINFGDTSKNESDLIGGYKYYIPSNNIPTGISTYRERVFISIARQRPGIPATLNTIDNRAVRDNKSPLLRPYPDAIMNELRQDSSNNLIADPSTIVSVYRTRVDDCNRLWFVDTGYLEADDAPIQPPSLWIMDVRTDKMIRRFEIPQQFAAHPEGFISITIDTVGRCDRAFAYIPNAISNMIVVYSLERNNAWSFSHPTLVNFPENLNIVVKGVQIKPIYSNSITLGRRGSRSRNRTAYFQPFGSFNTYSVSTEILKSEVRALSKDYQSEFKVVGSRGSNSQVIVSDIDVRTNVIFFADLQKSGVTCWDVKKNLIPANVAVVSQNFDTLNYISDIKFDGLGYVWIMSSREIFSDDDSNFDNSTYNFYVTKSYGRQLIEHTVCNSS